MLCEYANYKRSRGGAPWLQTGNSFSANTF
jgi:hypothetical protein